MTCLECSWDKVYARGLCQTCYERCRRRGIIDDVALPSPKHRRVKMTKPNGWLQVGDWVIEMEPDIFGRRLFGQVMKTKGNSCYSYEGELWASVKLAYTRYTVPLRVKNLKGYDGPIPNPVKVEALPKFDMRALLEVA